MRTKHSKKLDNLKKYASLYWEFFKIGMFTVGGGAAMIPQIQQVAVRDKGWMTEDEMLDCIAVCQALPGVIAINSGTYIGRKIGGVRGSIAATTGVITPSFIIIVLAVTVLGAIGENQYVIGAFTGVKAAVCGLILVTAVRLGKQSLKSVFQWILAVTAFIVIGILGINAIWVLIAGAVLGIIYSSITVKAANEDAEDSSSEEVDK
ncbi:MAG: chromate transporter [Bacillota bacterium]|nr:chromate transporter [Bacillota bacterium]